MRSTDRIAGAIRGSRKALVVAGSAAALVGVGAGTASAATVAPARDHGTASTAQAGRDVSLMSFVKTASASAGEIAHRTVSEAAAPARAQAPRPAAEHAAARSAGGQPGHAVARTTAVRRTVTPKDLSWNQVAAIQAHRADPRVGKTLPAADQLRPVALYGPQEDMALDKAQIANAQIIVQQALAKKMGVRSAVVAVATAMQESMLSNINYGTSDSLGLFQQRPSCGWGTAAQITDPAYASDAFLTALQKYQASNPDWARQPLYQAAQGVQASAFPTAYAKWENQAASLVQGITMHLTK
jgi:hypothetical protein